MASMHETTIRKMMLVDQKTNEGGNVILAVFDVEYAGVRIEGCKLFELGRGGHVAHGPRGKSFVGGNIRADFVDEAASAAVTERAWAVYLALTGKADSHA